MVCESSPSMRRVAGRVDHWDELSINRAGRKHSADFARVISRCRELKSINSRYREIDDFPISENDFPGNNYRYSDIRWQTPAGGEQLEHRKLAHDKQPTIAAGCIAILHKYSKRGGITTSLIKRYCVLCSKTYNTSDSCHYLPAGSRQAARGARICETSLLGALRQYRYHGYWALSYRDGIASWVVVTAELEIIASWDDRTSNR